MFPYNATRQSAAVIGVLTGALASVAMLNASRNLEPPYGLVAIIALATLQVGVWLVFGIGTSASPTSLAQGSVVPSDPVAERKWRALICGLSSFVAFQLGLLYQVFNL